MPHKLVKTCITSSVTGATSSLSLRACQSQILRALNDAWAAGRYRGEDDKAAELRRALGVEDLAS